jgi:hypothetical protein
MNRFPESLPQDPGAPLPGASEERALLALAEELRAACPNPAVQPGFADAVRARVELPWTMWRTLETSQLARAAATILVISISVAPIVALIQVLPWLREERTLISMERQFPAPAIEEREQALPVVPQPGEAESLDPQWIESIGRRNRLGRATASWAQAGSAAPRPAGVVPTAWEAASAEDLWQDFLSRCSLGADTLLPAGLVARVEQLLVIGDAHERAALAPWRWVLHGETAAPAELLPGRVWPGAPWVAE